jgi:hypothetical protein
MTAQPDYEEEVTDDQIKVAEDSLIADIIKHDQGLTPEQRREHRRAVNLQHYREGLERIQRLLDLNAPDPILAHAIHANYQRACSLWEKDMAHQLVRDFENLYRKRSNRCVACGVDLPYPVESEICEACSICD